MIPATNAILIDTDSSSNGILKSHLSGYPEFNKVKSYEDPHFAIKKLKDEPWDLMFLALDMPNFNGLEILQIIEELKIHVHVILTTSQEKLILDAAHYGMIDFLFKPIAPECFCISLKKYKLHKEQHSSPQNGNTFFYRRNNRIRIPTSFEELFFSPDDIRFLEADGNYTEIHTLDGSIVTSSFNLGRIQQSLPQEHFIRISRKVIVNFKYLSKIDKRRKVCILNGGVNQSEFAYSRSTMCNSGILD